MAYTDTLAPSRSALDAASSKYSPTERMYIKNIRDALRTNPPEYSYEEPPSEKTYPYVSQDVLADAPPRVKSVIVRIPIPEVYRLPLSLRNVFITGIKHLLEKADFIPKNIREEDFIVLNDTNEQPALNVTLRSGWPKRPEQTIEHIRVWAEENALTTSAVRTP